MTAQITDASIIRRIARPGAAVLYLFFGTTLSYTCAASDDALRSVALNKFSIEALEPGDDASVQGAFRGAIALSLDKKRFGGFSGLLVSTTGQRFIAISDHGAWFSGDLTFTAGRLTAARMDDFKRLRGTDGEKLKKSERDAEALAEDGSGGFVVAFERNHRILHYPAWRQPFFRRPRLLEAPADLQELSKNHGLEAMTRLCDGRYLVVAQQKADADSDGRRTGAIAWHWTEGNWVRQVLGHRPGFEISGAATLSDCSVAILERRRQATDRWITGIRRIPPNALQQTGGEPIDGRDLIGPFVTAAKFEGIAAYPLDAATDGLLLISDNDYKGPTILTAFAVGMR